MEYELLDTGVFDDDRYFDVEVEYAKAGPDDLLCSITVHNRGPEDAPTPPAPDAVVPQHVVLGAVRSPKPALRAGPRPTAPRSSPTIPRSGRGYLHAESPPTSCSATTRPTPSGFWDSENAPTPTRRTASTTASSHGRPDAVNPAATGTKAAAHVQLVVPAGGQRRPSGCGSTATPADAPTTASADVDGGDRRPPRGGRRVLRRDHPARRERRRGGGHAAGAGRDAVVEAVLLLRRRPLAARAQRATRCDRRGGQRHAQRVVVPHGQPRRHLDARQVGVPVVRGLGSRLPLRAADDGRPRLRQAAARR